MRGQRARNYREIPSMGLGSQQSGAVVPGGRKAGASLWQGTGEGGN